MLFRNSVIYNIPENCIPSKSREVDLVRLSIMGRDISQTVLCILYHIEYLPMEEIDVPY